VVVAFVIGYFVIGHKEIYFAMLTLAFSMILNEFATEFLGGGTGYDAPTTEINLLVYSISVYDSLQLYYLVTILVIIFSYAMWRVVNSPFGRVLVGIRSNQQRSESLGNDVDAFKLYSFVLSGGLGGMAGILFAMQNLVVTPTALHWSKSLEPAIATLIGGYGSFFGPVIGSFTLILLKVILGPIFSGWKTLLGIILIGIVMLSPEGFSKFILDKLAYGVGILKSKLF
jgi:branched-chain amino acid transport system permease protein